MDETGLPDLQGKILMVLLRNRNTEVTNILRDVSLQTQGGRLFLAGKVAGHPDQKGPFDDVANAIAWDEVAEYMIFDDIQDLAGRLGASPRKRKWF